jgi:hypothetical protein
MVRSRHGRSRHGRSGRGRCANNIGSFYICCNQHLCRLLLQWVSVAFGKPESQVHNFVLLTGLWHKIFYLRLYLPIIAIRVNARQAKFLDVVAQCGDVVAQSARRQSYTRLQRSSSGFDHGIPHSLLRGGRNYDCVIKTILRMWCAPSWVKKKNLLKRLINIDVDTADQQILLNVIAN